jgi:hypothetical protein
MDRVLNVLLGLVCAAAIGLSGWTLQKVTVLAERLAALEVRVPAEYPPKAFRDEVDRRFTMVNEIITLRVEAVSDKISAIEGMVKENNAIVRDIRDGRSLKP